MVATGVNAIETSFVKDYGQTVEALVQQRGSLLRPYVRNESFVGESAAFIEQVGEVAAVKRVARHADTPLVPTPMDRRWVFPTDYEIADLIDTQDRLRQIIDPTSPFAMAQAMALGRSMDDEIIEGILTDNRTGQDSGTVVPFPTGQIIPAGGTGMTIDKLREARKQFQEANVDLEMTTTVAVITPEQLQDLLETTEITSSDYNTVKALVNGEIDTYMGFKFVVHNRLLGGVDYNGSLVPVADTQSALFWAESGVGLGMWKDISARIDERSDKSYATQVYACGTFGATRLQEPKVIRVDTFHA